jgi:hypothetical protein
MREQWGNRKTQPEMYHKGKSRKGPTLIRTGIIKSNQTNSLRFKSLGQ